MEPNTHEGVFALRLVDQCNRLVIKHSLTGYLLDQIYLITDQVRVCEVGVERKLHDIQILRQ